MQMEQGTTKPTIHPLKLLALAYGLMPEIELLLSARSAGAGRHMKVRRQKLLSPSPSQLKSGHATSRSIGRTSPELPQPYRRPPRAHSSNNFPPLADIVPHARFAVNTEYATDTTPITAHAEIALIPPVSGG